jgi:hypothetical protein
MPRDPEIEAMMQEKLRDDALWERAQDRRARRFADQQGDPIASDGEACEEDDEDQEMPA